MTAQVYIISIKSFVTNVSDWVVHINVRKYFNLTVDDFGYYKLKQYTGTWFLKQYL